MFALADKVSAPDVRIVFCMILASPFTIGCITPMWYSTDISDDRKMIVGSTLNAKKEPVPATRPAVPSMLPSGFTGPTGTVDWVSPPKMKRAPCSVNESSASTRTPTLPKNHSPAADFSTISAKTACSSMPMPTRRQSIALRFSDIA